MYKKPSKTRFPTSNSSPSVLVTIWQFLTLAWKVYTVAKKNLIPEQYSVRHLACTVSQYLTLHMVSKITNPSRSRFSINTALFYITFYPCLSCWLIQMSSIAWQRLRRQKISGQMFNNIFDISKPFPMNKASWSQVLARLAKSCLAGKEGTG